MPKKSSKSVVKNTTKNSGKTAKKTSKVKRGGNHNPTGKNQYSYKSAVEAMKIYCEHNPEKVTNIVIKVMEKAEAGEKDFVELFIKLFGGFDKQQLDITSNGNTMVPTALVEFVNGKGKGSDTK